MLRLRSMGLDGLGATYLAVSREAWDARADESALGALLRARAAEARAEHPGVELSDEVFAEHVAGLAPDETDPLAAIAAMPTNDLFLACACARGDSKAIRLFEKRVLPLAEPAIARIDPSEDFVDEAIHELRIRLLVDGEQGPARIRAYLGRGPLAHWVRVVAMRIAYGLKRQRPVEEPAPEELFAALPFEGTSPETKSLRADLARPFHEAFTAALASLDVRERNVLRLYLLEGVPSEVIGTMYGVHRATVARWVAATHEHLLSETRRRLAAELGVIGPDLDTLMRLATRGIEISIATVLRS